VFVTNDAAVFHASVGGTAECPTDSGSHCCTRCSRYSNSTEATENASSDSA
jgi:hypothetical protein